MELIGKTSIHPLIFYSGKFSGYFTWVVMICSFLDIEIVSVNHFPILRIIGFILLFIGGVFTVLSLINLGKSTRLGLPREDTELKTTGLYQFSRNPMYVGFNLLTISSVLFIMNPVVIAAGLYSIFVYHLIIRAEEKFLDARFGAGYFAYKKKVRRYL